MKLFPAFWRPRSDDVHGIFGSEKKPFLADNDDLEGQLEAHQPNKDGSKMTVRISAKDAIDMDDRDGKSNLTRATTNIQIRESHRKTRYFGTLFQILGLALLAGVFLRSRFYGLSTCEEHRVPLEAHIMSKCPDARDCLHDLILPTMIRVADKVDFTLSYIGNTTDDDDGVACKHGPTECLGNMIELCAAKLYPDPKTYLGFTMCLAREFGRIPERSLVEDCALEHGIDVALINRCAADEDLEGDGPQGHDLLKASFDRTAKAGVVKSCTVRLDHEIRCIRDDGQWSDCKGGSSVEDLVADIERLARRGVM